jgi:hypothetical protein
MTVAMLISTLVIFALVSRLKRRAACKWNSAILLNGHAILCER